MPKSSLFTFWPPDLTVRDKGASFANWFSGLKEWNVLTLQGMECTYWFFDSFLCKCIPPPQIQEKCTVWPKNISWNPPKWTQSLHSLNSSETYFLLDMIHLLYFFFWVSNEKCSLIGSFLGFHVTSFDHRVYEKACGPRRHKSLLSLPISHRSLCYTRSLWHRVDRKQKTRNK